MRITNALSAVLIFGVMVRADAENLLTAEQWRQDLHYLAEQLIEVHPDPFHHLPEREFASAVSNLDARIPTLSDHAIAAPAEISSLQQRQSVRRSWRLPARVRHGSPRSIRDRAPRGRPE